MEDNLGGLPFPYPYRATLRANRVYVQNQRGPHPNKWDRSGVVVDVGDNEQYLVKIDGSGRLTLRNRRFLRQFVQPSTSIGEPLSSRCPAPNDLALQPRPYTMTATTPDQYHAATAPELHPPATPASPTVSKPQAQQRHLLQQPLRQRFIQLPQLLT